MGAGVGLPNRFENEVQMPPNDTQHEDNGTTWAILVAGSKGWTNYRHQADVCHAYQVLKKGGLKDKNIIVFMYDDIACNEKNPWPGIIKNHPNGKDVYYGVPKDYTGEQVNADNFFAVLLGDKKAVRDGSGKVVSSNINDRIFIYYSDHGAPGYVGMPTGSKVYGDDLIDNLNAKYKSHGYKAMVIYIEACESGSLFQGKTPLLEDMNIYATTSSDANKNSFATYCDKKIETCLGDLYSTAWLEDSEAHDRKTETLQQQYERVKKITSSSPVMQFGSRSISKEKLYLYQGFNSAFDDLPPIYRDHDRDLARTTGRCTSLITDVGMRLSPSSCLYLTILVILYFL